MTLGLIWLSFLGWLRTLVNISDGLNSRTFAMSATSETPVMANGFDRCAAVLAPRRSWAFKKLLEVTVMAKDEQKTAAPTTPSTPLNLRQKLVLARKTLSFVEKRGRNDHFHYDYTQAADIQGLVLARLADVLGSLLG